MRCVTSGRCAQESASSNPQRTHLLGSEPLPDAAKTEDNRIRGCASKLWLIGGAREDGTMMYQVDGDAHISKGTAKVVTDIVNGEHRSAVANLTVEDFTPLGIKELLTMQRQNGLGELIDRIIRIAND